jgi:AraC-like DNA-binding protein
VSQPGSTAVQSDAVAAEVVTSFAGGISEHPAMTDHGGRQHGIQVRLDPLAVYALFGVPMPEFNQHAGGVIDLAHLGAGEWGERLGAAGSWASRFLLLDELLGARLAQSSTEATPEVAHAWRHLRASHGTVRIAELVRDSGLSHRTFVRRFRHQVGVGPKTAARIIRYERAAALLADRTRSIADVAAATGYADQAHLDREFAAMAGRSPTRLLEARGSSQYRLRISVGPVNFVQDRRVVTGLASSHEHVERYPGCPCLRRH